MVDTQLATSTGHGTRRYEDDLVPLPAQPCYLVDEGRHAGDDEFAVLPGEHITAHFHYYSLVHFLFLISTLRILPEMVLGSSSTNSMMRGYL